MWLERHHPVRHLAVCRPTPRLGAYMPAVHAARGGCGIYRRAPRSCDGGLRLWLPGGGPSCACLFRLGGSVLRSGPRSLSRFTPRFTPRSVGRSWCSSPLWGTSRLHPSVPCAPTRSTTRFSMPPVSCRNARCPKDRFTPPPRCVSGHMRAQHGRFDSTSVWGAGRAKDGHTQTGAP